MLEVEKFQFTPLREGRRARPMNMCLRLIISIHAPPRGATGREADAFRRHGYFNSRPSARGDKLQRYRQQTVLISIHAPPRGATSEFYKAAAAGIFQFTPLREGRLLRKSRSEHPCSFQFTPLREGRHVATRKNNVFENISIHAPPRGATRALARQAASTLFQFTPLREGRLMYCFTGLTNKAISIHAPPRGATVEAYSHAEALLFQFTPLREGRRQNN